MTSARGEVLIDHPTGLHARPAVKFTKLAKTFQATVRLRGVPEGAWVDAKSIVKVMALKLKTGTTLELEGEGEDAVEAVEALRSLVARRFDEDG